MTGLALVVVALVRLAVNKQVLVLVVLVVMAIKHRLAGLPPTTVAVAVVAEIQLAQELEQRDKVGVQRERLVVTIPQVLLLILVAAVVDNVLVAAQTALVVLAL